MLAAAVATHQVRAHELGASVKDNFGPLVGGVIPHAKARSERRHAAEHTGNTGASTTDQFLDLAGTKGRH